jgi:hypothetical protein
MQFSVVFGGWFVRFVLACTSPVAVRSGSGCIAPRMLLAWTAPFTYQHRVSPQPLQCPPRPNSSPSRHSYSGHALPLFVLLLIPRPLETTLVSEEGFERAGATAVSKRARLYGYKAGIPTPLVKVELGSGLGPSCHVVAAQNVLRLKSELRWLLARMVFGEIVLLPVTLISHLSLHLKRYAYLPEVRHTPAPSSVASGTLHGYRLSATIRRVDFLPAQALRLQPPQGRGGAVGFSGLQGTRASTASTTFEEQGPWRR